MSQQGEVITPETSSIGNITQPEGNQFHLKVPPPSIPPVDPVNQPPVTGDHVFSAEDIEKARREEKDKLYPRIQQMEEELAELHRVQSLREDEEARATAEAAEAARRAEEAELDARQLVESRSQSLEQQIAELRAERERDKAINDKERQLADAAEYRARRILEEADSIEPNLVDMVSGFTREEVDQSIAQMQERTRRIVESVASSSSAQHAAMQGTEITGAPPVGPLESEAQNVELTPAQIREMPMEQYSKMRKMLLGAVASQVQERGMYG